MPVRTYYFALEDMRCAFCGGIIRKGEWHLKRRVDKKMVVWCGCAAGKMGR